jgi:hypothetical protein
VSLSWAAPYFKSWRIINVGLRSHVLMRLGVDRQLLVSLLYVL